MDAAAAGGGVERDAGRRAHVVCYLGATQCGKGAVRFPGGDNRNAMRCQHRTQPNRHIERQIFFQQVVRQARSAIGAPVSGVDHDRKMWSGPDDRGRSRGRRGRTWR